MPNHSARHSWFVLDVGNGFFSLQLPQPRRAFMPTPARTAYRQLRLVYGSLVRLQPDISGIPLPYAPYWTLQTAGGACICGLVAKHLC